MGKNNKLKLAGKAFRALFILLMFLLLLWAIIFRTNPKIFSLILMLFAGSVLIKRRYRKYFWLSLVSIIIILTIWIFLPESNQGWQPYRSDRGNIQIYPEQVSDENNAAPIYEKLKLRYKILTQNDTNLFGEYLGSNNYRIPVKDMNDVFNLPEIRGFYPEPWDCKLENKFMKTFWSIEEHPEMADWLKAREFTLNGLAEAAQKEKCQFPFAFDEKFFDNHIDYSAAMRDWVKLLIIAGNGIANCDLDRAIEKYFNILKMSEHLFQQPLSVDYLVAMKLETDGIERLKSLIIEKDLNLDQINRIKDRLKEINHNWSEDLKKFTKIDGASYVNELLAYAYESNPQGKIRFRRREIINPLLKQDGQKKDCRSNYRKTISAKVTAALLYGLSSPWNPERMAKYFDNCFFERCRKMAEPNYNWTKNNKEQTLKESLLSLFSFNYKRRLEFECDGVAHGYLLIYGVYERCLSNVKSVYVLIDLKQYKDIHGDWPQSLEEINNESNTDVLDPISKEDFVYKIIEEGFMLYSIGQNRIDDHGKDYSPEPNEEPDDFIFWPLDYRYKLLNQRQQVLTIRIFA